MLCLDALKLDGDFFAGDDVGPYVIGLAHEHDGPFRYLLYLSKCRQNFRCQSSVQSDICSPHEDPNGSAIVNTVSFNSVDAERLQKNGKPGSTKHKQGWQLKGCVAPASCSG